MGCLTLGDNYGNTRHYEQTSLDSFDCGQG